MKRLLLALLGLTISALALLLAFTRITLSPTLQISPRFTLGALHNAIRTASPAWLAAYLALNVSSLLIRALQLRTLCRRRDGTPPSIVACYHAVTIGMLAQNILPARLGEAARILALVKAEHHSVATSAAIAAVILGRVLDLLALLLVTSIPILLFGFDAASLPRLTTLATISALIAVLLTAAVFALYRYRATITRTTALKFPRLARTLASFTDGLSALGSPRRLFSAALPSLAAPLLVAASYASAFRAFGLDLPAGSSLVLVAVVFLAVAVPSAPSSVGVYHAAVTWLLPALGAPAPTAAAFAIVTHALGVVSFLALGLVSFLRVGTTLRATPATPPD